MTPTFCNVLTYDNYGRKCLKELIARTTQNMRAIQGLYWDNGKENGNCYVGFIGFMGIVLLK